MHRFTLAIGMISLSFLQSCSSFHFSGPQPVDRPDERQFPKAVQGDWWLAIEEDGQPDKSKPADYRVGKDFLRFYEAEEVKLVDRTGPADQSTPYPFRREVRTDSASGNTDTVDNFIIRNDLIYPVREDRLGRGMRYRRIGDTVAFTRYDTLTFRIGEELILRKVDKDLYLLSFRDGLEREARGWWTVIIAEPRGERVVLHSPAAKMKDEPSTIGRVENRYFSDMELKAGQVRQLMRDGWFEPSVVLSR